LGGLNFSPHTGQMQAVCDHEAEQAERLMPGDVHVTTIDNKQKADHRPQVHKAAYHPHHLTLTANSIIDPHVCYGRPLCGHTYFFGYSFKIFEQAIPE
ncbi:hypothetical protein STEG23_004710, partial [Scotinomys teguina]